MAATDGSDRGRGPGPGDLELAEFAARWPELEGPVRLAVEGWAQMNECGFFNGVADLNRAREWAEKIVDPSGKDAVAREGARLVLMSAVLSQIEWDPTRGKFVGPLPAVAEAAEKRRAKRRGKK